MGIFSSDRTNVTNTSNAQQTTDVGDGVAVVGDNNIVTDGGLIQAAVDLGFAGFDAVGGLGNIAASIGDRAAITARDLATGGFDLAGALSSDALSASRDVAQAGFDLTTTLSANTNAALARFQQNALDTVNNALDAVTNTSDRGITFAESIAQNGLDFAGSQTSQTVGAVRNIFSEALAALGDLTTRSVNQVGSTVSALNSIAETRSQTADQTTQKTILVALALMLGAFVLMKKG